MHSDSNLLALVHEGILTPRSNAEHGRTETRIGVDLSQGYQVRLVYTVSESQLEQRECRHPSALQEAFEQLRKINDLTVHADSTQGCRHRILDHELEVREERVECGDPGCVTCTN